MEKQLKIALGSCKRLHKATVLDPEVTVNADGTLANVFVYVKTGLEDRTFAAPKEPVTIDQHGCMFSPRVLGIQTGQPLIVKNTSTPTEPPGTRSGST